MFQNIFSFDGRIRRLEFGLANLGFMVLYLILVFLVVTTEQPLILGLLLPIIWILFAQGAKRCHDLGNSGWYQLIPFYNFWMLFADGQHGANRFGPNPKGIGNDESVRHADVLDS
jgi:uncharacterized membrane protein YhaH (DUF805 family)